MQRGRRLPRSLHPEQFTCQRNDLIVELRTPSRVIFKPPPSLADLHLPGAPCEPRPIERASAAAFRNTPPRGAIKIVLKPEAFCVSAAIRGVAEPAVVIEPLLSAAKPRGLQP